MKKRTHTELIEAQETSIKLAHDFINSEKIKASMKDVILSSLFVNGFSFGAYMGWFWQKDGGSKGFVSKFTGLFVKSDVNVCSHDAAKVLLKEKFSGASIEDKQVIRYAAVEGFKKGADAYRTKNS